MKAIVYHHYGSHEELKLEEVPKPSPKQDEVLVQVQAASVNALDWRLLTGNPFFMRLFGIGLLTPKTKILGADFSGVVEAVGGDIHSFKKGDQVFGCRGSREGLGAFAEYMCVKVDAITLKPEEVDYAQAASLPIAGLTALQGLRDEGQLKAGQRVAINGASGGVGTFAIQIAKSMGAEVTAICSKRNIEQAYNLGADIAVDYREQDFTAYGERFDLIFAVNGYHSLLNYKRALTSTGILVVAGGEMRQIYQTMFFSSLYSKFGKHRIGFVSAKVIAKDLQVLGELVKMKAIKPEIDRTYPLNETSRAVHYVYEVHAEGKVIIAIGESR